MRSFHYRAYAIGGLIEEGTLEADSREHVVRLLARKGSRPFEISEEHGKTTAPRATGVWAFGRRVDLEALFRDLDVLIGAGFDVNGALAATRAGRRRSEVRAIDAAIDHLKSGGRLADAFRKLPGCSDDLVYLLESGESSFDLAQQTARRNAMVEALIYPAFLLVMMLGALGIITFYLVPSLAPIFESAPDRTPAMLSILSALGEFLKGNVMPLAVASVGMIATTSFAWRRASSSAAMLRFVLTIPVIGPLMRDRAISRYLGAAALLTGHGVPIGKALELAVRVCPLKLLHPKLTEIRTKVMEGGSFVAALAEAQIANEATLAVVGIGEEANRLPQMLERASHLLDRQIAYMIDRVLKILTPVMTIVTGMLVGGLVLSVMTAILSLNDLAFE
jgi:general secretion pathway protein F